MLFRNLLLVATTVVAAQFVASQPFAEDDEITIAQVLDLSSWMNNEIEIPQKLIGKWKTTTLGNISLTPSSIASNTCFVQVGSRIVPGFFVTVDDVPYFVVGLNASAQLYLIPEVFSYTISKEDDTVVLTRVEFPVEPVDFEDFAAFSQCLQKQAKHLEVRAEDFVRF